MRLEPAAEHELAGSCAFACADGLVGVVETRCFEPMSANRSCSSSASAGGPGRDGQPFRTRLTPEWTWTSGSAASEATSRIFRSCYPMDRDGAPRRRSSGRLRASRASRLRSRVRREG